MNRISQVRKAKNLTQENIAKKLGIAPKTFIYYENEITPIPSNTLIKISKILDVSIDYLLGLSDVSKSTSLIDSFSKLKEDDQLIILNLIKKLRR